MNKRQGWLGCFGCILAILFILLACTGLLMYYVGATASILGGDENPPQPPSNETLSANFITHQTEFEALRKQLMADSKHSEYISLERIFQTDPSSTMEDLSKPPLANAYYYYIHLPQLGLQSISATKTDPIMLTAFSWGNLAEGSSCGYAYSLTELTEQRTGTSSHGTSTNFTPLKGNWYLFAEEEW